MVYSELRKLDDVIVRGGRTRGFVRANLIIAHYHCSSENSIIQKQVKQDYFHKHTHHSREAASRVNDSSFVRVIDARAFVTASTTTRLIIRLGLATGGLVKVDRTLPSRTRRHEVIFVVQSTFEDAITGPGLTAISPVRSPTSSISIPACSPPPRTGARSSSVPKQRLVYTCGFRIFRKSDRPCPTLWEAEAFVCFSLSYV